MVLVTQAKGQTLQFYEGVVAKKTVSKAEKVLGKAEVGPSTIHFVDGYTNREYVENLLEAWCRHKKLGTLGFAGQFLGLSGEAHVHLETLQPMFKAGEGVTTNYLYHYKGWVEGSAQKLNFNVVAKRFLPRELPARGNHEFAMLQALPQDIVPKTHGALVNRRVKAYAEGQVLVLFTDFLEDAVEVGKQIWDLMGQVSKKKSKGESHGSELKRLYNIVKEAINKVVFPFHRAGYETWHSAGVVIKPQDEYYKGYHQELQQNLTVLKKTDVISASRSRSLSRIFKQAWRQILSTAKATEIHRDLMWRQILRTKDKRLVILDLDEHTAGHAAKDIADLCAANRFIAEDQQSPEPKYIRGVAENLNASILKSYTHEAERTKAAWTENLQKAVLVYLAYRHLHDAAYYAPVWRQEKKAVEKKRYKRYVDFSLGWLENSIKPMEDALQ